MWERRFMSKLVGVFALVVLSLTSGAWAQAGTDPGWGLSLMTCNGQTIFVSNLDPLGECGDNFGPATFGRAETDVLGICQSSLVLGPIDASVEWTGCSAPLIAETKGGDGVTDATDPDFCNVISVAYIWGHAEVFNYFLGTSLGSSIDGYADCTDSTSPYVPPAISSC